MQSDRRLVEYKHGIRLSSAQFTGQFQPLGFPAGKAGCLFSQSQISQSQILQNLQTLLYLRRRGARGYLYDNDFVWTAIENETLTVEQTVEWGLLSVFSLEGRAAGIDEAGVQYPLSRASLTAEFPLGVSNHIIAPKARITVRQGALLVGWELPPTGVVSEIK